MSEKLAKGLALYDAVMISAAEILKLKEHKVQGLSFVTAVDIEGHLGKVRS